MILTNNLTVNESGNKILVEGDQLDVLKKARDFIHKGHYLITSPLAASGRMHFSPVRSILISDKPEGDNTQSLLAIENSIELLQNSLAMHTVDYKNKEDYEFIDYELLKVALHEVNELENRFNK
ncbi:GrdX family protein [Facklamia miroungae]|uniref:Uncharacterized protein n=1 Tax=Facklamia miroungae TaxID=120956 RepID=A0A1G7UVR4_9LACT|nr:GrdX family protein [Facklamia miroungae]NKZ30134.1 hypothetical protein [Facklamia miroungae]SDG51371.1 hypothetical protein SAMN05421791_11219 [Facklamia miroungae]